ncbi:MAG: ABC transporter ATP-binding protein [Pseudomonadota bacterium]
MALELKQVAKTVGTDVHVHPTDLRFERGTMNVLLGRTLAGKTTLMRMMAGLDVPTSGQVFWDGQDVTGQRVQQRDVAMVYQQFINYPSMTVYDNIASPLKISGATDVDARVREAAGLMKLDDSLLQRRPLELSGGQQQRCALARALVKGAGLVLLDEPLANLDYKLREELRAEIPKIFEDSGAIFVYATTEPHEALLLGGNTACLWEGRVTQFGPTPEVYRRPGDAVTAGIFSDPPMNFAPLTKIGGEIRIGATAMSVPAALRDLPDGSYRAGFRANHLSLDPGTGTHMQGRVVGTEITGSQSFVHLDHMGERWVALVKGVRDIAGGTATEVFVDPAHIYVFDADDRLVVPAAYAMAA